MYLFLNFSTENRIKHRHHFSNKLLLCDSHIWNEFCNGTIVLDIFFSDMTSTGLRNDNYSDDNFSDDESSPLTENIYGGR
jgi:hypothetical protein